MQFGQSVFFFFFDEEKTTMTFRAEFVCVAQKQAGGPLILPPVLIRAGTPNFYIIEFLIIEISAF